MIELYQLKEKLTTELNSIIDYWSKYSIDEQFGGFVGQIDQHNHKNYSADKGLILNARILWTYSAAWKYTQNTSHLELAKRVFNYLINYFYDEKNRGFYWLLNNEGKVIDDKKHIYAQAFAVYGLSEYYSISGDEKALELAVETYQLIIDKSKDAVRGGFTEAFSTDWQNVNDVRLSSKDLNVQKTMNTHLHIAEAFANLYLYWKDESLKHELISILEVILEKFIYKESGHLKLFFDEDWNDFTDVISYGHDVEAAWLLLHCAEISGDIDLINKYKVFATRFIDSSIFALDDDGGLWYETEIASGELIREKHWWPQAEFMIGAMNAFQLTGEIKYLELCISNWNFIKSKIIDPSGEWFWGIDSTGKPMHDQDKIGFWKCPYHNVRMCLELIKRIKQIENK